MKRITSICLAACLTAVTTASAWGPKGHDTVAYIAENHLTPVAAAAVDQLLDGRSLVYWANWADNARYQEPYAYTKTWHYINVDAGRTLADMPQPESGNIITGMREVISVLGDSTAARPDRQTALKLLTHFAGDLHQPLHTGHYSDLGGNTIEVKFFDSDVNLHSLWDSKLPEAAHRWGYSEWQQQIDRATPEEEAWIISGNIDDWTTQSINTAWAIYKASPRGTNYSYNEVAKWAPIIEEQLLRGGLRLAHMLNLIFDPAYVPAAEGAAASPSNL